MGKEVMLEMNADLFFKKLPDWLRWLLLLPVMCVFTLLLFILYVLTTAYTLMEPGSFLYTLMQDFIFPIGSLLGLFFCAPKYKVTLTSVLSFLWVAYMLLIVVSHFIVDVVSPGTLTLAISSAIYFIVGIKLYMLKKEAEDERGVFCG